ncbi:MAG: DUF4838 domain-containing protein [Thermoguttaceae bacterium]|jgi:hypothetical protein
MNKFWLVPAVCAFCFCHFLTAEETSGRIVLPDTPSITEKTAARELQAHIKSMTGDEFAIVAESEQNGAGKGVLYVGATNHAASLLEKEHPQPFLFDEIFIKAVDGNLVLTGHPRRGALYAVYTFLEDVCGCRWFTAEVSRLPSLPALTFPEDLCISYAPKIHSREMYNPLAQDSLFSARNKGNGNIDAAHGGRISILNGVHTFDRYISPDKYFSEHPDWFSEIDGERVGENSQLCLTNDEMRAELTRNVLEQLRAHPGTTIVDISQNDRFEYCTCEKCRAVDEEEGSHAGTLIRFLNLVAADIEKEFPEVLVETLAYQYTRKPPKHVKPRDNLLIRLCTIECDFAHPLTAPSNAAFMDDLSGWSQIAPSLFIWDYVTNYEDYIGPHPNWRSLAPNIRTFVQAGAIGLFEEGEGDDFCEMKNWVLMKLMWNPDLDTETLMTEFCDTYYGKEATPYILAYWNILLDRAQNCGIPIGCFYAHAWRWIDLPTLDAATGQMQSAEDAVLDAYGFDSPEFARLRKSRMALDLVWLSYYGYWQKEAERLNIPFKGPADFKTAAKIFSDYGLSTNTQGPTINMPGTRGKNWFANFANGTYSLFSYPPNADWSFSEKTKIEGDLFRLDGTDGRAVILYTPKNYAPKEFVFDFCVRQTEDSSLPSYCGLVFGAENETRFSYIALDRDNVMVASAFPSDPASETFNKQSPPLAGPRDYDKWHTLHMTFHENYIALYINNTPVFRWLPYPEPKNPNGKIGFFAENGSVSIRNVFFAGKRL